MTRKQYVRKVMRLNRYILKTYGSKSKIWTDRIGTPHWGEIAYTHERGFEPLRTYEQAWQVIKEVMEAIVPQEVLK